MVARGRGGGKTPENVVEILRQAVAASSQVIVANATGLTRLTIQRYLKGIGEPSQATLEKIADNFGVSVSWLRGYSGLSYEEEKERINLIDEHERLIEEQYTAIDERNSLMRESELIEKMVNYKDLVLEYKKVPSGSRLEALKILELISRLDNNSTDVEK